MSRIHCFDSARLSVTTCLLFLFLYSGPLAAQVDSTSVLPEVLVKSQPGYRHWLLDTLPVSGTLPLSDRLQWDNNFALRSNGPGLLATASARGLGPSRTGVFWQGVNVQSPMNGVADLSLIPVWPDDRVELLPGGQSATQSSGTAGGSIQINAGALPSVNRGWQLQAGGGLGSFGHKAAHASTAFGTNTLQSCARLSYLQATNNFHFRNSTLVGMPLQKQINNSVERFDFQQFNYLKVKKKGLIETAFWHQRSLREIPPSMTEAPTDRWQRDRFTRAVVTLTQQRSGQSQWKWRLAWLEEQIAFFLNANTDSSHSRTILASTEYFTPLGRRLILKFTVTAVHQMAVADGYTDTLHWRVQRRVAGAASAECPFRRGLLSMTLRQEIAEGQADPFSWVLGARWGLWKDGSLRAHLSRNFNLPTFNDRFWRKLGNPDLLPESGYSAEAALQWKPGAFQSELAVFHLLLDNWILWQAGPDGLFRPGNLRRVWSRGVEFSMACALGRGLNRFRLKGHMQINAATNTAVYASSMEALKKQLPYTPRFRAGLSAFWSLKSWEAAYLHQWTGSRFTISDNTGAIPAFQTGNVLLKYRVKAATRVFSFELRLENCWNAAYQIIAFRPMPGRNWHIGMELRW